MKKIDYSWCYSEAMTSTCSKEREVATVSGCYMCDEHFDNCDDCMIDYD